MSYDIHLFKKLKGKTARECAEEILESDDLNALDKQAFEKQKQSLAKQLTEKNPKLEKVDSEGSLELSDNKNGMQILVSKNQIGLSVPYWNNAEEAKKIIPEIFQYLSILQKTSGYSIYDPQTEKEISLTKGINEFTKHFSAISDKTTKALQKSPSLAWRIIRTIIMLAIIIAASMLFKKWLGR